MQVYHAQPFILQCIDAINHCPSLALNWMSEVVQLINLHQYSMDVSLHRRGGFVKIKVPGKA
jgi:hypothetical protein